MQPVFQIDLETLTGDPKQGAEAGAKYADEYQSGEPYHHICIDDFLPLEIVQTMREEALAKGQKAAQFESAQEHLKTAYNPETLPTFSRSIFATLNSPAFLEFLSAMTGIDHLIPDPYFLGAGIHRTNTGGYLNIHADFNLHKQMMLERRLNVLIYLNPDWRAEYGGSFEVWSDNMKEQIAAFPPIMNRMCCFSNISTSNHGNPTPVNHPNGDPRLSIALYYYTATWNPGMVAHSTLFRPRANSTDQRTRTQSRARLIADITPPILYRRIRGPLSRLGLAT